MDVDDIFFPAIGTGAADDVAGPAAEEGAPPAAAEERRDGGGRQAATIKIEAVDDDDVAGPAEEGAPPAAEEQGEDGDGEEEDGDGEEEGAGEQEGEQEEEEEAAAKKKAPPPPKRVAKTSIAFKSDVDLSSPASRAAHPRGILHATKLASPASPSSREEHAFAWIADNADEVIHVAVDHLNGYGFRPSQMRFIPFSSKENWVARYPHAMPYVDCDGGGNLAGSVPSWEDLLGLGGAADAEGGANSHHKKPKRRTAKGKKPPPKLLENGLLLNRSRDELHIAVHEYFAWLHGELAALEASDAGRRRTRAAGINVSGLGSLVSQLEGTFSAIRLEKLEKEQEAAAAARAEATAHGDGGAEKAALTPTGAEDGAPVGVPKLPPLEGAANAMPLGDVTNARPAKDVANAKPLPFLERGLGADLDRMAGARPSRRRSNNPTGQRAGWRLLPFDVLFPKLVAYREEHGHTKVPLKHPELGKWVCELRTARKALQKRGMEFELDPAAAAAAGPDADGPAGAGGEGDAPGPKGGRRGGPPAGSNTFLTEERVRRLDAVGFSWTVPRARAIKTWDERLEDLRQFRDMHGRFPKNKEGSLGGWLKSQKKLYSKKDANFMQNHCAKLEALGVQLRQRNYVCATWDERFQQLVEFGRINRHFNVPNPEADDINYAGDPPADVDAHRRFYKFVCRVQTEYRMWKRGLPTTMLNEERIAQLHGIGFEFSTGAYRKHKEKEVPELDWATRLQQMEAFLSEMGHLRIDPNYGMYGNLGGWAVQISELYRGWREGREYLTPDTVEKLNQLGALGFGFDVLRPRRGERSWEDSFGLLLQYRQETGSCRVPHHYKADFRLGSWVAVQRKEYKLFLKGKQTKMTRERIQRLESVGFEWVAKRGE